VTYLLRDIDPTLLFLILLPPAIAMAAWALQMTCVFCSVDPPEFWQSVITILVIGAANLFLRIWMKVMYTAPGSGSQFLAALVLTTAIVAIAVRTGPISAFMVTVGEGLSCGMLYVGLTIVGTAVLTAV